MVVITGIRSASGCGPQEVWYPPILDDLIASAAVNRLLHHAHMGEIEGHSYSNPPVGRMIA